MRCPARTFIGLLVDLQGPKIRIGGFSKGKVQLRNGRQFTIDAALGDRDGNEEQVGTSYAALVNDVTTGSSAS